MTRKMTLRQAADRLGIEPWKLLHLSRFLGINAYNYMIPSDEVEKWRDLNDRDAAYKRIREWLLNHPPQALPAGERDSHDVDPSHSVLPTS